MHNYFEIYNNLIIWAMSTINKTNQIDPLDQLLQNTYSDYHIPETQGNTWLKIKKKVIRHDFVKFNPLHFNIYYAVVCAIVTIGVGIQLHLNTENPNAPVRMQQSIPAPKIEQALPVIENQTNSLTPEVITETKDDNKVNSNKAVSNTVDPAQKKANISVISEDKKEDEEKALDINSTTPNAFKTTGDMQQVIDADKGLQDLIKDKELETVTKSDSTKESKMLNKKVNQTVIINPEPVVQTDTIVKVIKKKRKRIK